MNSPVHHSANHYYEEGSSAGRRHCNMMVGTQTNIMRTMRPSKLSTRRTTTLSESKLLTMMLLSSVPLFVNGFAFITPPTSSTTTWMEQQRTHKFQQRRQRSQNHHRYGSFGVLETQLKDVEQSSLLDNPKEEREYQLKLKQTIQEIQNGGLSKTGKEKNNFSTTNHLFSQSIHGMPWKRSIVDRHIDQKEAMHKEESNKNAVTPNNEDQCSTESTGPSIPSTVKLTFMPCWTWQMQFMQKHLNNLHTVPIAPAVIVQNKTADNLEQQQSVLPLDYRENVERGARVASTCLASREFSKIRMTHHDGGHKAQIFNTVWYPSLESNIPAIMGVDLLQFGPNKHVIIMDFQPLFNMTSLSSDTKQQQEYKRIWQRLETALGEIRQRHPLLQDSLSSRYYDSREFFSKHLMLGRSKDVDLSDVFVAFQEVVSAFANIVQDEMKTNVMEQNGKSNKQEEEEAEAIMMERYRTYDEYNIQHDPAISFFGSIYGMDWSRAFATQFLFSLCNENQN